MNLMNLFGGNPMMMQAMGAMMRGENPNAFLKKLAKSHPQLQGYDLDNLEATASALCQKNNIDMNQLAEQIKGFANSQ